MITTTPTRHVWKEGEACNFITARPNTEQGRRATAINGAIHQNDAAVALVKLLGMQMPRLVEGLTAVDPSVRIGTVPLLGSVEL